MSTRADATPLPESALESLQRSIVSLSDRLQALTRRFDASQFGLQHSVSVWDRAFAEAGREAVFSAHHLSSHSGKAYEAAAEEARVRAEQLAAYAQLFESNVADEYMRVVAVARELLLCPNWDATGLIVVDSVALAALSSVYEALRIREGVDPARCVVSGDGMTHYQAGDNITVMASVGSVGDAVESVEADDVCVSVEGTSVVSVAVREAGVVEVVYRVPHGCAAPVTLSVSVCGAVLPGSPWTIEHYMRGSSAILAGLSPETFAAFLHTLAGWLPRRAYALLYRGSRDGMTAAAFHEHCDNKGPTLVVVRSKQGGWVFGGYAGASWGSPPDALDFVACDDAFVFSVVGPNTTAPVRFPLRAGREAEALRSNAGLGPFFPGSLEVRSLSLQPTARFDGKNVRNTCWGWVTVNSSYESRGQPGGKLTEDRLFAPEELEVFAVAHGRRL